MSKVSASAVLVFASVLAGEAASQTQSAQYLECSRQLAARTGWQAIRAACSDVPEIRNNTATYRMPEAIHSWAVDAKETEQAVPWAITAASGGSARAAFWLGARYYGPIADDPDPARAGPAGKLTVQYLVRALEITDNPLDAPTRQVALFRLAWVLDSNPAVRDKARSLDVCERLLAEPGLSAEVRRSTAGLAFRLTATIRPDQLPRARQRAADAGVPGAMALLAVELLWQSDRDRDDAQIRRLMSDAYQGGFHTIGAQLVGLMLAGRGGPVDGAGAERILKEMLADPKVFVSNEDSKTWENYPGYMKDRIRVLLKRGYEQGAFGQKDAALAPELVAADKRVFDAAPQPLQDVPLDQIPKLEQRLHSLSIYEPSAAEYALYYPSGPVQQTRFAIERDWSKRRFVDLSVVAPRQGRWSDRDIVDGFKSASERLAPCGIGIRYVFVSRVTTRPELLALPKGFDWVEATRLPRTPLIRVLLTDAQPKPYVTGIAHRAGLRLTMVVAHDEPSGEDSPRHRAFTLAHELGHILGRMGHDFSVAPSLMTDASDRFGIGPPSSYTCARIGASPMLGDDPGVGTDLLAPTFDKPVVIDAGVRDAILSKVAPNTPGREHGLAVATAVRTLRAASARNVNSAQWRLLMLSRQIEQTLPGLYGKAGAWDFDYMAAVREVLTDAELAETTNDASQRTLLLQALAGTPDELTGIVLRGVDDASPKAQERLAEDLRKRVLALPRTDLAVKGTLRFDAWRAGEAFP